ncbi:hypothetical protein C6P46_001145 [Rhodotorula mucilaginosa]|uniref:Uncharacterized protein n=1 Tax=Rhodotorula mucilaginosa TaxID=5537 RepID=A0A9P6VUA2_RHOMI|nr:hypothetical protein C6P46_001145 [Rhodotorula mucilaginosa]
MRLSSSGAPALALRNDQLFSLCHDPTIEYSTASYQQRLWNLLSATSIAEKAVAPVQSSSRRSIRRLRRYSRTLPRAARRGAREAGLFVSSASGQVCREAAVWALSPCIRVPSTSCRLKPRSLHPCLVHSGSSFLFDQFFDLDRI